MDVFRKMSAVRYSFIIFSFLAFMITLLLVLFVFDVLTGLKWSAIISGLLTGFIIALFQAFLSWFELKKIDEYEALKIRNILSHRKDPIYYGNLISKAKKEINVLGVTSQRFLEDFGNENNNAPDNEKVLLKALEDGVKVRILIANKDFLADDDKIKATSAQERMKKLFENQKYSKNFEYLYYEHIPTHSIVIIDDECIVGPIFPNVNSKYTPAIHLKRDSQFAEHYINYFDSEWNQWKDSKINTVN